MWRSYTYQVGRKTHHVPLLPVYTSVEFTSAQYHVEDVVDTYATIFSCSPGHALQPLLPVEDGQRRAHSVGTKPSDSGMTNTVATRSGTMPIGNMRTAAVSAWRDVCGLKFFFENRQKVTLVCSATNQNKEKARGHQWYLCMPRVDR